MTKIEWPEINDAGVGGVRSIKRYAQETLEKNVLAPEVNIDCAFSKFDPLQPYDSFCSDGAGHAAGLFRGQYLGLVGWYSFYFSFPEHLLEVIVNCLGPDE